MVHLSIYLGRPQLLSMFCSRKWIAIALFCLTNPVVFHVFAVTASENLNFWWFIANIHKYNMLNLSPRLQTLRFNSSGLFFLLYELPVTHVHQVQNWTSSSAPSFFLSSFPCWHQGLSKPKSFEACWFLPHIPLTLPFKSIQLGSYLYNIANLLVSSLFTTLF